MVPVEPISLSIGAVALASLFSTCLECFDYFKAAQSFTGDLEILVNKLDCQKERLLTWGELVGISKTAEEGRNAELDTPKGDLVKRCLNSITSLCSDAETLQKNYGVQYMTGHSSPVDRNARLSSKRMALFRKAFQRIAQTDARRQPGVLAMTRWAIHDKSKFETLTTHIRELVDGLHNLVPVPTRSQETMVQADIASLDLSRLRLVQSACEGIYQSWSDAASVIIMASEIGTIDRRSDGEWIQDRSHSERSEGETGVTSKQGTAQSVGARTRSKRPCCMGQFHHAYLYLILGFDISSSLTKFYFVFTPRCLEDSYTKCYPSKFGSASLGQNGTSFLPPNLPKHWTLGQRITDMMDVHLGTVYIFTAPCLCAVRTALEVCARENGSVLRYMVRVDDRMSASCCPEETKFARLSSIVGNMKEIEISQTPGAIADWIKYVDRVWIEQRIYQLEDEIYDQAVSTKFERTKELLKEIEGGFNWGCVFLGEVEHCAWMMQTAPFPWKAKMPKESEIYFLQWKNNLDWERKYIGTFTPRSFKATSSYSSADNQTDLLLPNPKRQKLPELTAQYASGNQMDERAFTAPTYSSQSKIHDSGNVDLHLSDVQDTQSGNDVVDSMSLS